MCHYTRSITGVHTSINQRLYMCYTVVYNKLFHCAEGKLNFYEYFQLQKK